MRVYTAPDTNTSAFAQVEQDAEPDAKPAASTTLFRRPAPGVEIKPHPQAQIMLRSIALVVGWTLTISVFPSVDPASLDLDSNPYALTISDHLGVSVDPAFLDLPFGGQADLIILMRARVCPTRSVRRGPREAALQCLDYVWLPACNVRRIE